MECQICFNTVILENIIQLTECSHSLCKLCLERLRNRNCPFCRAEINLPEIPQNLLPTEVESDFLFDEIVEEELHQIDINVYIDMDIRTRNRRQNRYINRHRNRYRNNYENISSIIIPSDINQTLRNIVNELEIVQNNTREHSSDILRQAHRAFRSNGWIHSNSRYRVR